MMSKKNNNIYFNVWDRVHEYPNYTFYVFIGGRGRGKTFNALKGAYEQGLRFNYVRLTKEHLDTCCNPIANPFKAINAKLGIDVRVEKGKPPVLMEYREGKKYKPLGYGLATSTNGNIRGADFSDTSLIIYDEFINSSAKRTMFDEATYFFNLYETVNRNRELDGEPAVKALLLSNSNSLDNDLLRAWGLVDKIRELKGQDVEQTIFTDDERGVYIELIAPGEFVEEKAQTALYRATKGTNFYEMALNNEFVNDYFGDVKQVDFRELTPLVNYEDLYFYRHKLKPIIYVSKRKAQCTSFTKQQYKVFMQSWGFRINMFICSGQVIFQNYNVKLDCKHLLKNDVL